MAEGLGTMEQLMGSLGLRNPTSRFVGVMVAVDAAIYVAKPKWWFASDGSPVRDAMVPWWMAGVVTGAVAALFL